MESRPFLTYLSLPTVQIWWKIIGGLTFVSRKDDDDYLHWEVHSTQIDP